MLSANMALRCASLAQPGNGCPARLRASRTRVVSTIAHLPADVSVSSDCASNSGAIFMSAQRLLTEGLLDLVDFIAKTGGVLVAFGT